MTTTSTNPPANRLDTDRDVRPVRARGDQTKPSWKTSELVIYVLAVIGVLITSAAVGDGYSGASTR